MSRFVPNTNTFSLVDVLSVLNPEADRMDLLRCFELAEDEDFDPTHVGIKDRMMNFRNYGLKVIPTLGYLYSANVCTTEYLVNPTEIYWRVPTITDWFTMIDYIDHTELSPKSYKLKAKRYKGYTGWTNLIHATDEYGFKALPAGAVSIWDLRKGLEASFALQSYFAVTIQSQNYNILTYQLPASDPDRRWEARAVRLVRNVRQGDVADGQYAADYVGKNGILYPTKRIGNLVWTLNNLMEDDITTPFDPPGIVNNIFMIDTGTYYTGLKNQMMELYDNGYWGRVSYSINLDPFANILLYS